MCCSDANIRNDVLLSGRKNILPTVEPLTSSSERFFVSCLKLQPLEQCDQMNENVENGTEESKNCIRSINFWRDWIDPLKLKFLIVDTNLIGQSTILWAVVSLKEVVTLEVVRSAAYFFHQQCNSIYVLRILSWRYQPDKIILVKSSWYYHPGYIVPSMPSWQYRSGKIVQAKSSM